MLHRTCPGRLALTLALAAGLPLGVHAADREHYLPEDSEIVINFNVKQMLAAPFVKENFLDTAREALKRGPAAEVLKELGFDPLKDLDRIIIAAPSGKEQDRGLVIFRGRFNTTKLHAKADELAKAEAGAVKTIKVPDGKGGDALIYQFKLPELPVPLFATVVDEKTVLLSPGKDYIVDAIRSTGGKAAALKAKGLEALLEKIDARQSVSIAAISDTVKKLAGDEVPGLEKITAISGGLTLAEDLKIEVGISTKETEDAKELHDTVSQQLNIGLLLLAGLASGDNSNPGIAVTLEVLKSIRVSLKDKTVFIKGRVNPDAIQEILKKDK